MPSVIIKIQYLLGLFFMMFFLSACAGDRVDNWPKQNGQVLDEVTNKPIADAIVVARWKGVGGFSKTVCFHVESTTTDNNGKFTILAWKNNTKWKYTENQHKVITVYKAGYSESNKTYKERTDKQGKYYQESFSEPREERIEYLRKITIAGCGSDIDVNKRLVLLNRALLDEAEKIAKTEQDRKTVESLLYNLEIIELGFEEAERRHLARP